MSRRSALALLALAALALPACALLSIGSTAVQGAYVYVKGWLERVYQVPLYRAYGACLAAAETLRLTVASKELQIADAMIKAKDGSTNVWIKLEAEAQDLTRISVRHGLLGDEDASRHIHEAIRTRIDAVPPTQLWTATPT